MSDNIYPILQKADIFILPSKYEGMPISLIEAMGSALPIIASNVGGIPDMISDGENGIIISPNANDLADAISRLIKDQDRYWGIKQNKTRIDSRHILWLKNI